MLDPPAATDPEAPHSPGRIRVAAVAENREPYRREIELLFASLRMLGGSLARAEAVAYFIPSVEAQRESRLGDLGVDVRVADFPCPGFPYLNRLCTLERADDCDWLVVIDTDAVVAKDFSAELREPAILARAAYSCPLGLDEWESLFGFFGLDLPLARMTMLHDLTETVPYFNVGGLFIPGRHVQALRDAWLDTTEAILSEEARFANVTRHRRVLDQLAFTVALFRAGLPHAEVPVELNLSTHPALHPSLDPGRLEPFVIHHHHRLYPDRQIMPSGYEQLDKAITRVNKALDGPLGRRPHSPVTLMRRHRSRRSIELAYAARSTRLFHALLAIRRRAATLVGRLRQRARPLH
jgi:hypothetical protein